MEYMNDSGLPAREKRTGALSHFHGKVSELKAALAGGSEDSEGVNQRIRTLSTAYTDELLTAAKALSSLDNTAIIFHGCAGCAVGSIVSAEGSKIYTSALGERETILGGDEKLRQAIRQAYENKPDAIFILGTPVTAISNDDVNSVILELSEEINIPVVFIKTDGFQSKTAVNGIDLVSHALLLNFAASRNDGEDRFINLLSFSESPDDVMAILSLLKSAGLIINLLPQFSDIPAVKRAGAAAATVSLTPDEGEFFSSGLQEKSNVPNLMLPAPIGIQALRQWFGIIGEQFGRDFSGIITKNEEEIRPIMEDKPLLGKRVFISLALSQAAQAAKLIEDLGGTVCGVKIPYADKKNTAQLSSFNDDVTVIAGIGQCFELANELHKLEADLFLGNSNDGLSAAMEGIPHIAAGKTIFGYRGIKNIACSTVNQPAVFLSKPPFYRKAWFNKSGNWFVKLEVK
jgi:nitrogenase molybdenum-iron protein alpha chain